MTLQKELKREIKKIIIGMGDNFGSKDNLLHFIIDSLEDNGFSDVLDAIGEEQIVSLISQEIKLFCNDLEYHSSLKSVIVNGLSEFFIKPETTIAEAVHAYAKDYNIIGKFDEVINHVVTEMVEPLLDKNKGMTVREAILLIGSRNIQSGVN